MYRERFDRSLCNISQPIQYVVEIFFRFILFLYPKVRKERHWFSRKYYMSVMNIKEFMGDSLGRQFQGIISDALDQKKFSRNH